MRTAIRPALLFALFPLLIATGCAHTPGQLSTVWGEVGDDSAIAGDWVEEGPNGTILDAGRSFDDGVMTDWAAGAKMEWNYRVVGIADPLMALDVEAGGFSGIEEYIVANGRLTRTGPPGVQTYRRADATDTTEATEASGASGAQGDDRQIRGVWDLDVEALLKSSVGDGMPDGAREAALAQIDATSGTVSFIDGQMVFEFVAPGKSSREVGTYRVISVEGDVTVIAPQIDGQTDPMTLTVQGDAMVLVEPRNKLKFYRQTTDERTRATTEKAATDAARDGQR